VIPSYVVIFGTRPEATKLHKLVSLLQNVRVWFTGQHQGLLKETCDTPELQAFYQNCWKLHLDPMADPFQYADRVKWRVARTLRSLPDQPNAVIVQGDTSSAYGGALGAEQAGIPVIHVEAGVRSHNPEDPWPEEGFRRTIDQIASLHFAPTSQNRDNLLSEGISGTIHVTGQTGLDDLPAPTPSNNHVLITLHRRETLHRLPDLAAQLDYAAEQIPEVRFLWPAHRNPHVQHAVQGLRHVAVSPPMGNRLFRQTLAQATLVVTDSGGVQEEAADLGVPCLVARNTTDRPESVTAGVARVIGTEDILTPITRELLSPTLPRSPTPCFGSGTASTTIADILNKP
jgi:UDP-N-acetylglucosamine 2-epimerase (non-hydrolysing)